MKYKNSFFKLFIEDDGTYIMLYPPVQGGKRLDVQEVISFLEQAGLEEFSIPTLTQAIEQLGDERVKIKLSDQIIQEFSETAKVTISKDHMVAYIRFYPPSNNGSVMTKKEILAELEREKISFGILEKVIDVFVLARQYCLNIPIAKGVKPELAKDTIIEYTFNSKPLAKPKVLEDGSVDFHELSLFAGVSKGDVLARLTPAVEGKPGKDIFGKVIPTNRAKIKKFKYGNNISLSEDKLELISDVDGNVTLTNDTVFVSDVYKVASDVDASTGDIDYPGSVYIPGTVRTGFTVRAKGDVEIDGVVEGATVIAGGNIIIKRGVQGMNKGELLCGGDICAQFFESANVKASGNVTAGSILHSNVTCGNSVYVRGKKGFIVGGEIICDSYVEVNAIGNKMETQTQIKVGVKPELYEEMKHLVTSVTEMNEEYEETASYLNVYKTKLKNGAKLSPENLKQIKIYNARLEEMQAERTEKNKRLLEIREILDAGKNGSVKVSGNTYRGVSIFISTHIYNVKEKESHVTYRISEGEVSGVPF